MEETALSPAVWSQAGPHRLHLKQNIETHLKWETKINTYIGGLYKLILG